MRLLVYLLYFAFLTSVSRKRFVLIKGLIQKEGGYVHPNLQLFAEGGMESGIFTDRILPVDEIVLRIPFKLCIYSNTIQVGSLAWKLFTFFVLFCLEGTFEG